MVPSSSRRQGGISSGPAQEGATHFSVPGMAGYPTGKLERESEGSDIFAKFCPGYCPLGRESGRSWTAALTICIRLGFKLSASPGENPFSRAVPSTRRVGGVSSQWAEGARRATPLLSTWALGPSSIRQRRSQRLPQSRCGLRVLWGTGLQLPDSGGSNSEKVHLQGNSKELGASC